VAVGVNYWLGASLVVRLSYHQVDGNVHTFLETPEQVMAMLATGRLEKRTDLIVFGAQFSF
jgi:hypothetical protein